MANRTYEWAGAAALKLNASKTKAMICGYRAFVDSIFHDLPRIEVSGISVPCVETAENLNVTIDSKFTWKLQVEAVAKKSTTHFTASISFATSQLLNCANG